MYSRRDLGKLALASMPLARALGARINAVVNGVTIGAQTYSYRALPHGATDSVDVIIEALKTDGVGEIELFSPGIEPPPGPGVTRESLRQWRLTTPREHFVAVRKKFNDAGVTIHSYTMNYSDDFTDEEIDKTFDQAKGLGTDIIASSTRVSMAPRLLSVRGKTSNLTCLPRPFQHQRCERIRDSGEFRQSAEDVQVRQNQSGHWPFLRGRIRPGCLHRVASRHTSPTYI